METVLRIFSDFQQDDWSDLLPIIQYQLNSHFLNATKQILYKTWMGFVSRAHQPIQDSLIPTLEDHKKQLQMVWKLAGNTMNHV